MIGNRELCSVRRHVAKSSRPAAGRENESLRFPNAKRACASLNRESFSPSAFQLGEKVAKPDEGAVLAMPWPASPLVCGRRRAVPLWPVLVSVRFPRGVPRLLVLGDVEIDGPLGVVGQLDLDHLIATERRPLAGVGDPASLTPESAVAVVDPVVLEVDPFVGRIGRTVTAVSGESPVWSTSAAADTAAGGAGTTAAGGGAVCGFDTHAAAAAAITRTSFRMRRINGPAAINLPPAGRRRHTAPGSTPPPQRAPSPRSRARGGACSR